MKLFVTSCVCLIFGMSNVSSAKCLPSASYLAAVKVNECDEEDPGNIFIQGELLSVSKRDAMPAELGSPPIKGQRYLFYKFLSPLVRDNKGALQKRKFGYCKETKTNSILKGILSRPCCDANYAFCKRPVDFLIAEPGQ